MLHQIDQICKQKDKYNRRCGDLAKVNTDTRCFTYQSTSDFPTIEAWYESFPHVYFLFAPEAYIPLYPRDYFFLEGSEVCMVFDYLEERIILGGAFMRNYDIQFDRNNSIVKMVRSECSPMDGINFDEFYMHHIDDRVKISTVLVSDPLSDPRKREEPHEERVVDAHGKR